MPRTAKPGYGFDNPAVRVYTQQIGDTVYIGTFIFDAFVPSSAQTPKDSSMIKYANVMQGEDTRIEPHNLTGFAGACTRPAVYSHAG